MIRMRVMHAVVAAAVVGGIALATPQGAVAGESLPVTEPASPSDARVTRSTSPIPPGGYNTAMGLQKRNDHTIRLGVRFGADNLHHVTRTIITVKRHGRLVERITRRRNASRSSFWIDLRAQRPGRYTVSIDVKGGRHERVAMSIRV